MTQGRTLAVVAVAAAIAGWLVVRMLGDSTPAPPSAPPVAASPAVAEVDEPVAAAPAAPAGTAPGASPAAFGDLPDLAESFTVIENALLRDRQAPAHVLPDDYGASRIPSSIAYRRADEFWQPMFSRHEEDR